MMTFSPPDLFLNHNIYPSSLIKTVSIVYQCQQRYVELQLVTAYLQHVFLNAVFLQTPAQNLHRLVVQEEWRLCQQLYHVLLRSRQSGIHLC